MIKKGIYKHYKGNLYKVLGTATHSESLENMVIYEKQYDDFSAWVRPIAMFEEWIEIEGKTIKRFEFVG